jgi:hypothetical protein
MNQIKRLIAITELLLLTPACLFMLALIVRSLSRPLTQAAIAAQQIVMWYAGRMWTLWVLLIALPLAVLVTGCTALLPIWNNRLELRPDAPPPFRASRAEIPTLFIAAETFTAAVVLAVVAVHMLMN